jgi:hypothetical protein
MRKIGLELLRWCFVCMTLLLFPIAFVVFCFQCSFIGISEMADKVWNPVDQEK